MLDPLPQDRVLSDLDSSRVGQGTDRNAVERFMCAGQPGAELLLSTITPNVGQCAQVSKQAYNRRHPLPPDLRMVNGSGGARITPGHPQRLPARVAWSLDDGTR